MGQSELERGGGGTEGSVKFPQDEARSRGYMTYVLGPELDRMFEFCERRGDELCCDVDSGKGAYRRDCSDGGEMTEGK